MNELSPIRRMIDHTVLKPQAKEADIFAALRFAIDQELWALCIHPCHVKLVRSELTKGQPLHLPKVCTVIGFPLGAHTSATKLFESDQALAEGADELDMVINIGALKDNRPNLVRDEIAHIAAKVRDSGALLKVIIEVGLLTDAEIATASHLAEEAGAHFVKTSTGFAPSGASVEAVEIIRSAVSSKMAIKASGGIYDLAFAKALIAAGASRLGTSQTSKLIDELTC